MATELLRIRVSGGYLTITDVAIVYEGKLIGRRSLVKSAYTGMDSSFYFIGRKKLTFRGQGSERLEVLDVKNADASRVQDVLETWR